MRLGPFDPLTRNTVGPLVVLYGSTSELKFLVVFQYSVPALRPYHRRVTGSRDARFL